MTLTAEQLTSVIARIRLALEHKRSVEIEEERGLRELSRAEVAERGLDPTLVHREVTRRNRMVVLWTEPEEAQ